MCDRPYTESVGSPPHIFKYIVDISGGGAPNTLLGTLTPRGEIRNCMQYEMRGQIDRSVGTSGAIVAAY